MDQISSIIVALCLMLIMLGMGLSLTIGDFQRVAKRPRAISVGLLNQLIFLPLIGFAIAKSLALPSPIAIGLMILVACPGGATSNLITHLAKGDTALSISLTAVASLITLFSIPFIIGYALYEFSGTEQVVELNALQMIGQLLIIVLIPVSIGMLVRAKKTAFALKMDKPVRRASGILLAIVTISLIIKERDNVIPYFQQAGLATILLNGTTVLLGFTVARLAKLGKKQGVSVAIESGIQNSALAMTIATITLNNTTFAITPAIYTLVMYASGFFLILYGRSNNFQTQDNPSLVINKKGSQT